MPSETDARESIDLLRNLLRNNNGFGRGSHAGTHSDIATDTGGDQRSTLQRLSDVSDTQTDVSNYTLPYGPNNDPASPNATPSKLDYLKALLTEHAVGTLDDTVGVARDAFAGVREELQVGMEATRNISAIPINHLAKGLRSLDQRARGKARKSSNAFVTMTTIRATTALCRTPLSHRPFTLIADPAPDSRDLLWQNLGVSRTSRQNRQILGSLAFIVFSLFWTPFVASITVLGTGGSYLYQALNIDPDTTLYDFCTSYLPSAIQLSLLALIPVVVEYSASSFEKCRSGNEVQETVLSRYFVFQIANILITVSVGSFGEWFQEVVWEGDASGLAKLLVARIPLVGSYFIELIIIKLCFGLTVELARLWPSVQWIVATSITPSRTWTRRSMREAFLTHPEFLYGWIYPSIMSVMVITLTYQIITPIMAPFALIFFFVAELVYKNQALYVYHNKAESGGTMWILVFNRTVAGLLFSHVLLTSYFFFAEAFGQSVMGFALIVADVVFYYYCTSAYIDAATYIPLGTRFTKAYHAHQLDIAPTALEQMLT